MNVLFHIFACKTWPWSLAATKCKRSKMWNGKAGWRDIKKYIDTMYPTFKLPTSKPCGITGYPWQPWWLGALYLVVSICDPSNDMQDHIDRWVYYSQPQYSCGTANSVQVIGVLPGMVSNMYISSLMSWIPVSTIAMHAILAKNPFITQDHWHRWKHVMKVISATLCIHYISPFHDCASHNIEKSHCQR